MGLLELLPQLTWVVSEFLCRRGKGMDLIILQNISDIVAAGRTRFRDLYFSPSQISRPWLIWPVTDCYSALRAFRELDGHFHVAASMPLSDLDDAISVGQLILFPSP